MARSLVQSKIAKELRGDQKSRDDELAPGHMRLYSFYKPSLRMFLLQEEYRSADNVSEAGRYTIEVSQTIKAYRDGNVESLDQPLFNRNTPTDNTIAGQDFNVIAPQFSLDPKLINSFYPPPGHQDEARILPHIVFNDPHVPWFREAGRSPWMLGPVDTGVAGSDEKASDSGHNLMPWLAVLVFQQEELLVGTGDAGLLQLDGMQSYNSLKLPADGAFAMTVGQYLAKIKSRVYYEAGYTDAPKDFDELRSTPDRPGGSPEVMKAIFPKKSQVSALFNDEKGDLAPLKAHKLLAHVRHMNTIGFPDAGVEEEGYFSVVVSSTTGNQLEILPSTHVVHLVSLEHLDATLNRPEFASAEHSERIGLVSLFSWMYTCMPDAISFPETMQALGEAAQPLKPPKETLDALKTNAGGSAKTPKLNPSVAATLHDRLDAGYTLARWRTSTGEESVAFNRGPLVPMRSQEVPHPVSKKSQDRPWPALSMTGKDYQVFDKNVGIMDVTYSSAWSLGKMMAISDSEFNAALMRFRSSIWNEASSETRKTLNGITPKVDVIQKSLAAISSTHGITAAKFSGPVARIQKPVVQSLVTSMTDEQAQAVQRGNISDSVKNYASVQQKSDVKDATLPALYNGFDGKPGSNSDWEVILNWVHNVMYMATIPAHVLFPEPSHLHSTNLGFTTADQPSNHPEALRFFHIDHAWVDCFLDGALSCANHLEPEYDFTRLRIKSIINDFLAAPIASTGKTPPVPRYGFVVRSAAIKATPDLRLKVTCWTQTEDPQHKGTLTSDGTEDTKRDPLVRHTKLDDFTIFSLVDCLPEEICQIKFSQPPHQQRFAFEYNSKSGETERTGRFFVKKLYTEVDLAPPQDPQDPKAFSEDDKSKWLDLLPELSSASAYYREQVRSINPQNIANDATTALLTWAGDKRFYPKKPPFTDAITNSAILGLELNDPAYELEIKGTTPDATTRFQSWVRSIWCDAPPPPSGTIQNNSTTKQIDTGKDNTKPTITIQPFDPMHAHPLPPTSMLNSSKAIQMPNPLADQRLLVTGVVDPFQDSLHPQFQLLVHPDYLPPPPLPQRFADVPYALQIHSQLDFLPTKTEGYYGLVFAIRRRQKMNTNPRLVLRSLVIEIPVSEPSSGKASGGPIREPLLSGGDYSGAGVAMVNNLRFVPTLFSGVASRVGSKQWDERAILGIQIVPRSGLLTGTIALLKDDKAMEVSVRLGDADVVPIVDGGTTAMIKRMNPQTNKAFNKQEFVGRSMIRLTEVYEGRGQEWSWCAALKRDQGDVDLQHHVV
ncbi:hypothetical protein LTS15_005213 [Exophiala xenobiotica]|nr:hypothetical protein LTS15_005213 [Exophiala xenobiotica]